MASIKKKKGGGEGGANWMDTYGDMVTLLLCFFVLLYSISTIDQTKWMLVVQSFNKDAIEKLDEPSGPMGEQTGEGGNALPIPDDNAEIDEALEQLYDYLVEFVESSSSSSSSDDIVVSKGSGYVFISFAEAVFFGPDSSVLRQDGKDVLDGIIPALRQCAPAIDELKVIGNTAHVREPYNNPITDRQIASMRATEVVIYLQQHIDVTLLNPGRLVPIGYGEWRPVADNDSAEGRARNRRVEMIITGQDLDSTLSGSYEKYETMLQSTGSIDVPD